MNTSSSGRPDWINSLDSNSSDRTPSKKKTSSIPFFVPLLNPLVKSLLRVGLPMGPMTLLTVRGRKSGQPHTTPVGLLEREGHRYVFATFGGEASWVHNLRAAGEATLTHGGRQQKVSAMELSPEVAGPILKDVLAPY